MQELTAHGFVPLAVSSTTVTLQSALIAAAVSILVAVFSQFGSARRERAERVYQRRRAALLEVQDAALALRRVLADYGTAARAAVGARSAELLGTERDFDNALGVLEVSVSRVDDAGVRELVTAWRLAAQVSFISVHDVVSRLDEQRAWTALNVAIGNALGDG
ncbi:MAG TPA: hypothetical protein VFU36_06830 [Jatrophihabitans sp.]|nr:hypothetical protein [Jatrophihabitans sp.]